MNANRILKIAVVIVLTVAITLGIPGTFAKYTDSKNYKIVVDYTPTVKKDTATSTGSTNMKTVSYEAEHDGYYAIIIRGGNGAMGLGGLSWGQTVYNNNGSVGGYVYACIYAKIGDKISACIGNSGTVPSGTTTNPGKNSMGIASGAKGDHYHGSTASSSGSGGAATIVTVNGAIVAIAAGGGGGGGHDGTLFDALAKDGKPGGKGGNINNDSTSQKKDNEFIVYFGYDGSGSKKMPGKGGTTSGGAKGESPSALYGEDGKAGSAMNVSGLSGGNGGTGATFGGGGGGGYAGGGGGCGSGMSYSASGGGGGSSAILLTNNGKTSLKLNSSALSKIFELAGYSADFNSYSGGFAIVAYLNDGTDTSPYSGGIF